MKKFAESLVVMVLCAVLVGTVVFGDAPVEVGYGVDVGCEHSPSQPNYLLPAKPVGDV